MARYCEECRRKHWPKTDIMGNFKCQICGTITYCHIPDDRNPSKQQIDDAQQEFLDAHGDTIPQTELPSTPEDTGSNREPREVQEEKNRKTKERRLVNGKRSANAHEKVPKTDKGKKPGRSVRVRKLRKGKKSNRQKEEP